MRVLAFGIVKEIFGAAVVEVPAPPAMNIEHFKAMLVQQYPALDRLRSFAIAVNGAYAQEGHLLDATDEVAIIPPVSGG